MMSSFYLFIWLLTNIIFLLGLIYLSIIIIKSIINLENLPIDLIILYYFSVYSKKMYNNYNLSEQLSIEYNQTSY